MQQPSFSLSDKVAVVTGASRGIGKAIAGALAGAGATVVLMGRDGPALAAATEEFDAAGFQVHSSAVDVTDTAALDAAFASVAERLGGIDILVNNAGMEQVCPALEVDEALWDRIVGVNLKGAFFCAQAAARRMQGGGAILNLCSLTSEVGVPTAVPYGASKSGLAGVTRALAVEWAPRGIRVNGLGPGYFRTALTESFYQDAAWQRRMLDKIPMGRFGDLNDLCGSAVFLCSDAAAYITGQILYVDGGFLASI
jgi:gluconate 5-dehydrogenase